MTGLEERIVNELRAESDLVPRATPAPLPQQRLRWARYVVAAAAMLVVVSGSWWLFNRPSSPVASSVTVISVTGDSDTEIVDLWADWWRAYAEVRETASIRADGNGLSSRPGPLKELAVDSEAAFQAAELLMTVEVGGGPVEVGKPSQIRLAPHIQVEDGLATIRDCVYLDPIPWPGLRHTDSTAGTALITAEAQLTAEGWRISWFRPEPLVEQLAAEPCQPGIAD